MTIRPIVFDIRAALLAKHAQHVVLIHFPIALFLTGIAFDFAAHWAKRAKLENKTPASATLASVAQANLLASALFVLPAVVTGILAWQWQLEGERLKGVLLLHLVMGSISAVLIAVVGWVHLRSRRFPDASLPIYRLPLEFMAALVVIFTGHLGGFLSGVNGPG